MVWGAIASAGGSFAGNLYNDYRDRKAQKREYKYNSWLQKDNQAFQKFMAENAHQMEMADLKAAGLNPALTAHQSSAGAIAGSSAAQGTSDANSAQLDIGSVVDNINKIRQTNAVIDKTRAEIDNIDANTEATKRGGLHQWWLGEKNPVNAVNKKADKINKKADKIKADEKANQNKDYNDVADKFDNFWGSK